MDVRSQRVRLAPVTRENWKACRERILQALIVGTPFDEREEGLFIFLQE